MDQQTQTKPSDLLTCFFEECESRFRFLENKHGYLCISGLVEYRNHCKIIKPYKGHDINAPFLAIMRYEKGERAIEILYGDHNYILEVYFYIDLVNRLNLKDLLLAARNDLDLGHEAVWIIQQQIMQEILNDFAAAVHTHAKTILEPSPRLVERSLTMRDKLTEQAIRGHYEEALINASAEAAAAYLKKDYRSVVETLQPFERDLGNSDLKKLKLAREKLQ